jgi:hypothetical protein
MAGAFWCSAPERAPGLQTKKARALQRAPIHQFGWLSLELAAIPVFGRIIALVRGGFFASGACVRRHSLFGRHLGVSVSFGHLVFV